MTEIKSLKDLLDDLAKKPPEKRPPERVVVEPEAWEHHAAGAVLYLVLRTAGSYHDV